ncbi:Vpu protein [Caenorhabditis elegans]|uniref:Vpu protein n=1 Tax=Caenorhabditis elegans TaxID=6239 RepID=Q20839_CAEEL|nr:Vpu protein [Caenorhabditis elegans]CCD70887.1 Vpu protein [Caenorhabditis elegans]|eukprot:NP_509414.1 Uncharacterized protein CELE_F55E10.1 [Caenorhabditis elegans]
MVDHTRAVFTSTLANGDFVHAEDHTTAIVVLLIILIFCLLMAMFVCYLGWSGVVTDMSDSRVGDGTLVGYDLEVFGPVDWFDDEEEMQLAPGNPAIIPRCVEA